MSDSWVISLGAGREQIPLIEAIKREGHKCLAFDSNPSAEGRAFADHFENISNRDVDGILAVAGRYWIRGVMAAASEVPDVMATVGNRIGVGAIPVATGMLLKDKLLYKRVLAAAGVPHTEAHEIYGGSVKALFDKLKYEVVVKPRSGSGSRGVFICRHDPMGLVGRLADSAENDHHGLIMERYQAGPQISSESIIWDGHIVTPAFVDRFYEPDSIKELGGSAPSEWQSERQAADRVIMGAAEALGIARGTLKCDLVLTEQGPKIIELTCRLSGGPLSEIVLRSTGVRYFPAAVHVACGEEPRWGMLVPRKNERISVDMHGWDMDWEESRKYLSRYSSFDSFLKHRIVL